MANEDLSIEFKRMNQLLSYYCQCQRFALNVLCLAREALANGFWPNSRYAPEEEDQYIDNGIMLEEYAEVASFVGRRRDRLASSFRAARDV